MRGAIHERLAEKLWLEKHPYLLGRKVGVQGAKHLGAWQLREGCGLLELTGGIWVGPAQQARRCTHDGCQQRDPPQSGQLSGRQVAVVPAEHFIPPVARDDYFGVLRHLFADDPGWQAGGIAEGLIVLFDDLLEELWGAVARADSAFMMFATVTRRHLACVD